MKPPEVYVHSGWEPEDPVRTFYEIPDRIAQTVRSAATFEGETFASCLHNLVLERQGALGEVKRLKRGRDFEQAERLRAALATVVERATYGYQDLGSGGVLATIGRFAAEALERNARLRQEALTQHAGPHADAESTE